MLFTANAITPAPIPNIAAVDASPIKAVAAADKPYVAEPRAPAPAIAPTNVDVTSNVDANTVPATTVLPRFTTAYALTYPAAASNEPIPPAVAYAIAVASADPESAISAVAALIAAVIAAPALANKAPIAAPILKYNNKNNLPLYSYSLCRVVSTRPLFFYKNAHARMIQPVTDYSKHTL